MHDVKTIAGPQHHVVTIDVKADVGHRHDGAVRDVADGAWLTLTQHQLPNRGTDAVSSNQRNAFVGTTVPGLSTHAVIRIFVVDHAGARNHLDVWQRCAGVEQGAVQVNTMDHDVGPPETFHEGL